MNLVGRDLNGGGAHRAETLGLGAAGIVALGDALTESTLQNIVLITLLIESFELHLLHNLVLFRSG